jgi:hypothetical protein
LLVAAALACSSVAPAQHNHAGGHHDYMTWASKKTGNCCNNQDCGSLTEGEWRETDAGTEVQILGEWCPVQQEHLIIRGKSPDWTKAHACINKNLSITTHPCQRLLCFAGMPKS